MPLPPPARFTCAVAGAALLLGACTTPAQEPRPAPSSLPVSAGPAALSGQFAVFEAGRSAPISDPIYPQRGTDALDVLHYGLQLSWSRKDKILSGTATLAIRPVRSAARIRLDFMPYAIDAVTVDGTPVTAVVKGEKLTIPAPVTADKPVVVTVRYHGRPRTTPTPMTRPDAHPLGLTIADDGGLWTMQEPFGAFTWYPVNDQPSDKALYDIAVTAPPGWAGIASGTPAGRDGNTFRYRSTDPVASYLTTLAVGPYRESVTTGPHGLPIHLWYRDSERQYLPMLQRSGTFLSWLEQHFGPYPFPSAGLVLVPGLSGMETQQMVTLGLSIPLRGERAFDLNTLHEYAHHWFGDTVTPTGWRDLWLNEGWALYAQKLYEQDVYGLTDAQLVRSSRKLDAELRKEFGPPGSPKAAEFGSTNVYTCTAGMLRQLHRVLGDDRFFALARDWAQNNRNTNQDRASFTAFVNRHTGRDLTTLIDAWLDSPTTPPEQ